MEELFKDFKIQPVVDVISNRVCGGEILWRPGGKSLTNDNLEELDENPSLNLQVAKDSFLAALGALSKLRNEIWLSINISTKFIGNGKSFMKSVGKETNDFDTIRRILGKRLVIEVTERYISNDTEIKFINQLSELHSIAIDDFGSGCAPLENMLNMNFDKVKVDKAISTGIDFNLTHQRFIKWLIAGCHAIDVQVCAEGIETESELMVYKRYQVDYGQGYLWSPAIDFNDFEKLANPMSTAEFSLGQLIK